MTWVFLMAALSVSAWACPEGAPRLAPDALSQAIGEAEDGFDDRDAAFVRARHDAFLSRLGCLDAVLDPSLAASWHRLAGLRAYLDGLTGDAEAAFAASRRLADPVPLPAGYAPGQELDALTRSIPLAEDPALAAPAAGALWLDGRPAPAGEAATWSAAWPALLQWERPDGGVETWLLQPGDALPEAPFVAPPRDRRWIPWAAAAGASAAVAGLGYGLAARHGADFAAASPSEDYEAIRSKNHAWAITAWSATGVAAGASAGALWVGLAR